MLCLSVLRGINQLILHLTKVICIVMAKYNLHSYRIFSSYLLPLERQKKAYSVENQMNLIYRVR